VSCNLCPGAFIVLGEIHKHEPEHERWKTEGRPAEFRIPLDEKGIPF
jgi:hypothetical protein